MVWVHEFHVFAGKANPSAGAGPSQDVKANTRAAGWSGRFELENRNG